MIFFTFSCSADKVDSAATIQQEAQVDPLEWDFWEDGPYRVGYIKWDYTFINPAGNERTIPMNLWYPTNDDDGDDVFYLGSPDPLSFGDAEPMAPVYTEGFPVFVYSHGSYGYGGTSSFLSRHFASHGWLVIAPDHLGNTIVDYGDDVSFGVRYNRPGDDWAAIDALDSIPDWSLPINSEAVILSGHSYGGYDNWAVAGASINMETVQSQCDGGGWAEECTSNDVTAFESGFKDARVKGIIPMAGAGNFNWFEEDAFHNISIPALVMSGTNDDDDPQYLWDNSDGTPMTWVEIEGACHQAFALGGCMELTNEDGFRLINGYSLAFSRQVLLGDSSPLIEALLQGSTVPDGIQIQTRE